MSQDFISDMTIFHRVWMARRSTPLFSQADLDQPYHTRVTRHDRLRGRSVTWSFAPRGGHFLSVEGRGVPYPITIVCDGELINVLSYLLLTAPFEELRHLVLK